MADTDILDVAGTDTVDLGPTPAAPSITATSEPGGIRIDGTAPGENANWVQILRGATSASETELVGFAVTPGAAWYYNDNTPTIGVTYYYNSVYWTGQANTGLSSLASTEVSGIGIQAIATTTAGQPSNVVAVRPNLQVLAVTNLVGFALNQAALLRWTNPAVVGSVVVQRRLQVPAGTEPNAWVNIATLTATTPGVSATVPNSYLDSSPPLTNGTVYEYDVYGLP